MRVGSFVVEGVFIRENPAAAAVNMSGMCIVRCEYIYSADQFVYEAVCDEFDDVLPGRLSPDTSSGFGAVAGSKLRGRPD